MYEKSVERQKTASEGTSKNGWMGREISEVKTPRALENAQKNWPLG